MNAFEIDGHKLMKGDAIKLLKSIQNNSVNLIFVDPPYNIGKDFNGYNSISASKFHDTLCFISS